MIERGEERNVKVKNTTICTSLVLVDEGDLWILLQTRSYFSHCKGNIQVVISRETWDIFMRLGFFSFSCFFFF
jgi:hypothetical protein